MALIHVAGKNKGKIVLYGLSTCGWCKKTKALLNDLGVAYEYTDVDQLECSEKEAVLDELEKYNPAANFPTLVINSSCIVIGFKEADIKEALK